VARARGLRRAAAALRTPRLRARPDRALTDSAIATGGPQVNEDVMELVEQYMAYHSVAGRSDKVRRRPNHARSVGREPARTCA
jgi:hypothetical protein